MIVITMVPIKYCNKIILLVNINKITLNPTSKSARKLTESTTYPHCNVMILSNQKHLGRL